MVDLCGYHCNKVSIRGVLKDRPLVFPHDHFFFQFHAVGL